MKIILDQNRVIGQIKPMHGIGQPPLIGLSEEMFPYLSRAAIPYSRLHDVGGGFGGNLFADIHNIFRDFSADAEDPASYDFAFTDWLILRLREQNCEPIFRLGETIENFHTLRAYRIFPPSDPEKWASVCEHIVRHYNEGWADGYRLGLRYFEIWNEPDNGRDETENQMWQGSDEQYYELYAVTAKRLKAAFGDGIRIGGYASCGFRCILSDPERFGVSCKRSDDPCFSSPRSRHFLDFFEGFFAYLKTSGAPIDFFSWHSYLSVGQTVAAASYLARRLAELGYADLETHLNEWNTSCTDTADEALFRERAMRERGSGVAAAKALSMMCEMQRTGTALLCYYDARVGVSFYGGMFDPLTRKPFPLYGAFLAFGELFRLGGELACRVEEGEDGVSVLCAGRDGRFAAVIANPTGRVIPVKTNFPEAKAYLTDSAGILQECGLSSESFVCPPESFLLFKNF